jgi:hypothetical protein
VRFLLAKVLGQFGVARFEQGIVRPRPFACTFQLFEPLN